MSYVVLSDNFVQKFSVPAWTRTLILITTGSWIIAGLAQFAINLPFTPVPITGQTLGVLFVATTLGAKKGIGSVATYILQGVMGLPFFAEGNAGIQVLYGPTAGYLAGFLIASYVIGLAAEKNKDRKFKTAFPSFLIGYIIIFTCGITWLSQFVGFTNAVSQGLLPFIPGEIIKLVILSIALPTAWSNLHSEVSK